jgi:tetratricopeptide (TPR) repeat protein
MSAAEPSSLLQELVSAPASERLAVIERAGSPVAVLTSLSEEAERSIVSGVAAALDSTEVVSALADELGDAMVRARARRARARAMAYAGRLDEALRICNEVIDLADAANVPLEAAHARLASMHALGEQGRFDEAIAAGESARQAFLDAGMPEVAGRAETNIGTAHQRRDDPARALLHFDRARAMLINDPIAVAQIDSNRGEALLATNNFVAAEEAFISALQTFERSKIDWAAAIVTGTLADLCARQGRLHEAMDRFERARRLLDGDASS